MPVDMPSHPFQIIPQTPSDLRCFLFFFCFIDWNLHIPASTLGFFNLFWFGHAQPALPHHTSDSPGPKVLVFVFWGFIDWNLRLPASSLGFFNLCWFTLSVFVSTVLEMCTPRQGETISILYIYIYICK